jgi:hypothetical protein
VTKDEIIQMTSGPRGPKCASTAGLPHYDGQAPVPCLVPFEHGPGISDEDWICEKNLNNNLRLGGRSGSATCMAMSLKPACISVFYTATAGSISSGACANKSKKSQSKRKSFKVAQVKQKFGGLRFYFEGGKGALDAIRACFAAAAQESFHICEVCGQPGALIGHNRTRCDLHFHLGSRPETVERYRKLLETSEWARGSGARVGPRGCHAEQLGTYAY